MNTFHRPNRHFPLEKKEYEDEDEKVRRDRHLGGDDSQTTLNRVSWGKKVSLKWAKESIQKVWKKK